MRLSPEQEGITKFFDGNENQMSIYDAANKYRKDIPGYLCG